jgi:dephospho-CoA kinase
MKSGNRNMVAVGIVGPIAAGKNEFADILEKILKGYTAYSASYSDILTDELKRQGKRPDRKALQRLGGKIAKRRQWWLEAKMRNRILRHRPDVCVIAGLRMKADAKLVRSFPKHLIVAIRTDQRIRYERSKKRGRLGDGKTWTRFLAQDRAPIERRIKGLMRSADVGIDNNGSFESLVPWAEMTAGVVETLLHR